MSQPFSKVECQAWIHAPNINPQTGRSITPHGTIYNKIARACSHYGVHISKVDVPAQRTEHCRLKWIMLTSSEAQLYNMDKTIHCKYCLSKGKREYALPHFVHAKTDDDIADYQCCRCNGDGNIVYFCFKCKNLYQGDSG